MYPSTSRKITRFFIAFGIIMLIAGFILPFIPYWVGLLAFVYSGVVIGVVNIAIPPPDELPPEEKDRPQ